MNTNTSGSILGLSILCLAFMLLSSCNDPCEKKLNGSQKWLTVSIDLSRSEGCNWTGTSESILDWYLSSQIDDVTVKGTKEAGMEAPYQVVLVDEDDGGIFSGTLSWSESGERWSLKDIADVPHSNPSSRNWKVIVSLYNWEDIDPGSSEYATKVDEQNAFCAKISDVISVDFDISWCSGDE